MKNIQLIGLGLVVAGSFLPLVRLPIIGNWNYWQLNSGLAIVCWIFSAFALTGIVMNKIKLVKVSAIFLVLLFGFTLVAIRFKSLDFFSFLPFKSWQNSAAGIVKLAWGWLFEFSGAVVLLIASNASHKQQNK